MAKNRTLIWLGSAIVALAIAFLGVAVSTSQKPKPDAQDSKISDSAWAAYNHEMDVHFQKCSDGQVIPNARCSGNLYNSYARFLRANTGIAKLQTTGAHSLPVIFDACVGIHLPSKDCPPTVFKHYNTLEKNLAAYVHAQRIAAGL